jgi:AGCS family alanine or glycine:cation symporter
MDLLLAADGGIDQTINDAFTVVSTAVQDVIFYSVTIAGATFPLVVAWLALAAIIFTIYYRFINFRGFTHAIRLVKGEYTGPTRSARCRTSRRSPPRCRHRRLGNIAGVAVADQPSAARARRSG